MLMTHEKYRQFTTKTIADARTTSGVLICLFGGQPAGRSTT